MPEPEPNFKPENTINKMREAIPDLTTKIKASDTEVQLYITALEKDNLKLQRVIAKQRASYLLLEGQIQIKAEEEADRIVSESKLIAEAEHEASKYDTSQFLKRCMPENEKL
jgi:hypothetical protein